MIFVGLEVDFDKPWISRAEARCMRDVVVVLFMILSIPALAQDLANGARVFVQCRACHQVGEGAKNTVGPMLNGLFGRPAGAVPEYAYSSANKSSGVVWDEASFRDYIRDPRAKIPGTKMIFGGLKDEQKVDDLIAYLKQFEAESVP